MNDTTLTRLAALAAPLDDPRPCGENLEYDPRFLALAQAAGGKPEVQYGSTITPAEPPDWKAVRELALALGAETRDLRVGVFLARALLAQEGWQGLAAGLAVLAAWLSAQWDGVHPQLDPEDGCDPALRINTLAMLVEPAGMLREVHTTPLVAVRAIGTFALEDIEASGSEGGGGGAAAIDTALRAADPQALDATRTALASAAGSVGAIHAALAARLPAGTGLDTGPLAGLLRRALQALEPYRQSPGDGADAEAPAGAQGAAPFQPAAAGGGDLASRADVVRHLERLCGWYARHEPASPVPLLLRRAQGLVDKNFTELLRELAPDGLNQLAQVSGIRSES